MTVYYSEGKNMRNNGVTVAYRTKNPLTYNDILGKYHHTSGLGWNAATQVRDLYESEEQWRDTLEKECSGFLKLN